MAAKEFSEEHVIPYYEGDMTNHITLEMLVNILVLASGDQNNQLGVDQSTVIDKYGLGWVVTSYSIKIKRLPKVDSKVEIFTKGTSFNKYFAFRQFWIKDLKGNVLVSADSIWVLMDEKTRRIAEIPQAVISPYGSQEVKRIPKLPRPLKIKGDAKIISKQYQVRYNDIDLNGHVNNTRYFDWMTDVLGMQFLNTHQPTQIDIRFEDEVRYGDIVESRVMISNLDDGSVQTVNDIQVANKTVTNATIVWKKLN